jgi:hypothetical protein
MFKVDGATRSVSVTVEEYFSGLKYSSTGGAYFP